MSPPQSSSNSSRGRQGRSRPRRSRGQGSNSSSGLLIHPFWRRRVELVESLQASVNSDFAVSKLLTADLMTDRFRSCIIHSVTVMTNATPPAGSFPWIFLNPGWVNGDSHPSLEVRGRGTSPQSRATATFRFPSFLREPWASSWKFATVASNCTSCIIRVDATFM